MTRRLIVRGEAELDLTNAALWYEEHQAGLGMELILEVRAALQRAVKNPSPHLLLRRQPEVRRILARRFPFRVFFIVREKSIVVDVLHAARHDQHW